MINFAIKTDDEYQVNITESKEGQVEFYHFTFTFLKKISPKPIKISWLEGYGQYAAVYTPTFLQENNLRPDWGSVCVESNICQNMPAYMLLDKNGDCQYTLSLSDVVLPARLAFGFNEESNQVVGKVTLFATPCAPMDKYEVTLRIDKERSEPYTAGQRIMAWWATMGYCNDYVPESAFEPLYSSWYNFHQNVTQEGLLNECRIAAKMGMKTLIIDDGWQTDDNNRGYAYCGDWEVTKNKFPDYKQFVADVHALGMKVAVWYAVPFIGEKSAAFSRFEGKYLYHDEHLHASILDPRYKEVRDYLTNIYVHALKEYDLDGFKLDFIDCFRLENPFTHNDEMDCYSVEDGVAQLLEDIRTKVLSVKKDALIEFRQLYYGPVIGKYANMLRVADCPGDMRTNLNETIRMRVFSSNVAIHSDMFTCHQEESVEFFLLQFIAAFFSVPQFSFMLASLSDEKLHALQYYIEFHSAHRETLLKSDLRVYRADKMVSRVDAKNKDEKISVLYNDAFVELDDTSTQYIINGRGQEDIIVQAKAHSYEYTVKNCLGEITETGIIQANSIKRFDVTVSGMVEFQKQA